MAGSVVAISGRNLVVITFLAAVGIIVLKALIRVVPTPSFVKQKVGEI